MQHNPVSLWATWTWVRTQESEMILHCKCFHFAFNIFSVVNYTTLTPWFTWKLILHIMCFWMVLNLPPFLKSVTNTSHAQLWNHRFTKYYINSPRHRSLLICTKSKCTLTKGEKEFISRLRVINLFIIKTLMIYWLTPVYGDKESLRSQSWFPSHMIYILKIQGPQI